ncbi:plasmid mobilization relaxosome protein MobC [Blautia sp. CLA-JM-H16]|uniref:Plasmid mobilization relaxosome protein MobC n=1 Tax=Blautia aquisgranensis TaxID=3133153 RepID=A0ABV1BI28_9FIRM
MTRPPKETDMKREHRVTIRLTDTEFSIIENAAEQAEMSISEYMRTQTMEGQVNARFEIVADVAEIKKLIGEFGKIGSNLNQIARYFNQGGIISTEMKNEIRKSLRDIYEMKYEVMKMAGDFHGSN